MYKDISRPPTGRAPGELPPIKQEKIPLGTTVWGMLPMGVGSYGKCTKPKGHCKAEGAPESMHSSEFLVCFAYTKGQWHEIELAA